MTTKEIDIFEKKDLLDLLATKEFIFQTVVKLSKIKLSEDKKTAWVTFDNEGKFLNFYFNPGFWESLSLHDKAFVISHECLHVILKHGMRISQSEDPELANKAADFAVNELLIRNFDFPNGLEDKKLEAKICLHKNLSSALQRLLGKKVLSYEEYYKILYDSAIKLDITMLDDHGDGSGMFGLPSEGDESDKKEDSEGDGEKKDTGNGSSGKDEKDKKEKGSKSETEEIPKDALDEIMQNVRMHNTDKRWKDFQSKIKDETKNWDEDTYGPNPYSYHEEKMTERFLKNVTWKKLFRRLAMDERKISEKDALQWVKKNRRNNMLPSNLIVPDEVPVEMFKKEKPNIQIYLDYSGSCRGFVKDFWKVYESVPKKDFNVFLFTVTDYIYPVTNKVLKGSCGNAPFEIIETNIQKMIAEKDIKKYPSAIIVITDGHAGGVSPELPKKWFWVLPREHSDVYAIPKESKIIYLDEIK